MSENKTRPSGITVIAVLWTLSSIYNLYVGFNGVITALGVLPILSDPRMPEWFRVGVPAELIINFLVVIFAFLTLYAIYGLYTAKSWSYYLTLLLPIIILALNIWSMMLYFTAPAELELGEAANAAIPFIIFNLIWFVGVWEYFQRPHVRHYLQGTPLPSPPTPISLHPPPPPTTMMATPEKKKFCRYCGAENKTDAVFCEGCGKKGW